MLQRVVHLNPYQENDNEGRGFVAVVAIVLGVCLVAHAQIGIPAGFPYASTTGITGVGLTVNDLTASNARTSASTGSAIRTAHDLRDWTASPIPSSTPWTHGQAQGITRPIRSSCDMDCSEGNRCRQAFRVYPRSQRKRLWSSSGFETL